jgi:hypothetical protein
LWLQVREESRNVLEPFWQNAQTFGLNLTIFFPPPQNIAAFGGPFFFFPPKNTLSMSCSPFVLVTIWQKFAKKKREKKKLEIIVVFLSPKCPRNKTLVSSTSIYLSSSLMGIWANLYWQYLLKSG